MAGTIIKRGDDTYRLFVSIGSDSQGRPVRKTKTVHVKSKREAELELAKFSLECERLRNNSNNDYITVKEFADLFWKEHVEQFTKISTKRGYKTAIYFQIVPRFGEFKLKNLKALDIQKWINNLNDDLLSPKTIKNYFSVLNNMFATAIKWDMVATNPCSKVTIPKQKKTESRYYNEKEVKLLLEALEKVPQEEINYKTAIYIALFGGLRKSEILGLNIEDYNPNRKTIKIVRGRLLAEGIGPYEDNPKSETSIREISIPDMLCAAIDKLIEYHDKMAKFWANKWVDSKALIKGIYGKPMYPQSLQRWFTKFVNSNQLPYITLHGLRHTHTAMMASMTDDITQISRRLGHSQISTTMNIYTHLFKDNDRDLADMISEKYSIIGGKENE